MIITPSDLDRGRESRVKPKICSRSEVSWTSLTTRLAQGCKRWHPLAPWRRYGTRRSPLSEYMSLHLFLKLTTNCGPLSRIKWEIYFYKEVFRSFIDWVYNNQMLQEILLELQEFQRSGKIMLTQNCEFQGHA